MRIRGRRSVAWIAGLAVAAIVVTGGVYLYRQNARAAAVDAVCDETRAFAATLDPSTPITSGATRVVVLGDSYAMGWHLGGPTHAWPQTFGEDAGASVYVNAFGGSGVTTSNYCPDQIFSARADSVNALDPDAVIVQTGLNDAAASAELIEQATRDLVADLDADRVVIVGPPLAPARDASDLERVDAALSAAAEASHAQYVSLLRLDLPYADDLLHTTEAGQQIIGEAVAEAW